ncbi:Hypp2610 [Branchiostoma lanceolatum]|uniref:Hypp2610 protein n=1 Tax=Branchiostoma lanceolatum TaxID=7740 RepID=A0A8J9ZUE3_BRALA|nr:Hypp2610 [Branchiostoma lanceolatum]
MYTMAVQQPRGKLASPFVYAIGCFLLIAAPTTSQILINEVNTDSPGDNNLDFIELSDGGRGNTSLDNLVLVLYDGVTDTAYGAWDLSSYRTSQEGLFVIGSSLIAPTPDLPLGNDGLFIQDGISAAVLYRREGRNFTEGMPIQTDNVEDVLVYGEEAGHDRELTDSLTPGQLAAHEDPGHSTGDESLSRCCNYRAVSLSAFTLTTPTPGAPNQCGFPCVIINEINVDQPGTGRDTAEFVELYDTGMGNQSLDGLTLVFYNGGKDTSYDTIDLSGYHTNSDGYFVIGSQNIPNADIVLGTRNLIQNGPDAIALYHSPASEFPQGSYITNDNLVDAVVYGTDDDVDTELLRILLPGQPQLNESPRSGDVDLSLSRCSCCARRDVSSFGLAVPTPGGSNQNCSFRNETFVDSTVAHQQEVRVNELSARQVGQEWVELFDGGHGNLALDNMVVVLYSRRNSSSYYSIELTGNRTDRNGYLLIGSPAVTPPPHIVIDSSAWFLNSPGAVALYHGKRLGDFSVGSNITTEGLVDAVVYGTRDVDRLLNILTPDQPAITAATGNTAVGTITRCFSQHHFSLVSFTSGAVPTPAAPNICPLPPLVINELKLLPENTEYIELSSQGRPYFPLQSIVVVFYNADGLSYKSIGVDKVRTDEKGLYLIGSTGMTPQPDFTVQPPASGFIKNGPNAVALYQGRRTSFLRGTLVTNASLIDAVVYSPAQHTSLYNLTNVLTSGRNKVVVNLPRHRNGSATSRCRGQHGVEYVSVPSTPKDVNFCSFPDNLTLIINEVNMDTNNRTGSQDFIELWDGGVGNTPMDGAVVVLYGSHGGTVYKSFSLLGYTTDHLGYFVIGTLALNPAPQLVVSEDPEEDPANTTSFIQHGPGAVALYGHVGTIPVGMAVTNTNLIDAVVYGTQDQPAQGLLDVLTPGQHQVDVPVSSTDVFSISRCEESCCARLNSTSFSFASPTPTGANNCTATISSPTGPPAATNLVTRPLTNGTTTAMPLSDASTASPSTTDHPATASTTNQTSPIPTIANNSTSTSTSNYQSTTSTTIRPSTTNATVNPVTSTASTTINSTITSTAIYLPTTSTTTAIHSTTTNLSTTPSAAPATTNAGTIAWPTLSPNAPKIVINELNADSPRADVQEFLELFDLGAGSSSLDGYCLVFYNGASGVSYETVNLTGHRTSQQGYFTVGSSRVSPTPDIIINFNFIQNGPDAVGLYFAPVSNFPTGSAPTTQGLVDVVVYGNGEADARNLLDILAPGQTKIQEDSRHLNRDETISRCLSNNTVDLYAFVLDTPSPGYRNNCTLPNVVINEINADEQGLDRAEFVELYSPGKSYASLDGIVLVLYNGDSGGTSYNTIDLRNQRTDENGYFVIGGPDVPNRDMTIIQHVGFIQNGPDAMALYRGYASHFPYRTPVMAENIIDAVVYGRTDEPGDHLLEVLLPGQHLVQEDQSFQDGDESISRCRCCAPLSAASFRLTIPTPGEPNDCVSPIPSDLPTLVINEINVDMKNKDDAEFVELRGDANSNVSGMLLVFFSGTDGRSYLTLELEGTTDPDGYFLIGHPNRTPLPDVSLPSRQGGIIKELANGIGLYYGSKTHFPMRTNVTDRNLLDAVVYTTNRGVTSQRLLDTLTPGQDILVEEYSYLDNDDSLSRCQCCATTRESSMYVLSPSSPGKVNICPSKLYSTTIQVKLGNANCTVFKRNLTLFEELKRVVASEVETRCQCGFTVAYMADAEVICGSTILNATLQAVTAEQLDLFRQGYEKFVDKTEYLTVGGQTYSVEPCAYNCLPVTRRKPQGLTPGVKAAIGICCSLAAIVLLLGVIYVWNRRGKGKSNPEWRESWSLSNPAELAPAYSIASFDNPLYDDESSVKNSGFL